MFYEVGGYTPTLIQKKRLNGLKRAEKVGVGEPLIPVDAFHACPVALLDQVGNSRVGPGLAGKYPQAELLGGIKRKIK